MAQQILPINTFTTAKWIVSPTSSDGTHTTIASALAVASSGDTIFIRPGTYTENPNLVAGVNLTAYPSDSSLNQTGAVVINGKCSFSSSGSVTISGIELQTNSDFVLSVTGSSASVVNLVDCNLNCTNNTGISFSSSNAAATINITGCDGNLGTTNIGLYSSSSAGTIDILDNYLFSNSGGSTLASSASAGVVNITSTTFNLPIAYSSTATGTLTKIQCDTSGTNTTPVALTGSGTVFIDWSFLNGGTASALTIGSGKTCRVTFTNLQSNNTNVATGAGTLNYWAVGFPGTSTTMNVTTQTGGLLVGGVNQAPSAGFIGEQIRSAVTSVSLSNTTPANATSINLTAGVWDVSIIGSITCTGAFTEMQVGISTNSASFTGVTFGDNGVVYNPSGGLTTVIFPLTVPSYRMFVSTTTTVYLVAQSNFSTGSSNMNGRISATRVG